ncbi:hypothetical protein [Marinobacter sp.]|uniref:hypothetical protein n=1 Tax=Marinobacter sp. TaxID=50741 RepID=UPI002B45CA73|nr:hypothetical protein [Marinobacter sp.]HKK56158.1 hypothetical protein [Marinobacter sp.]
MIILLALMAFGVPSLSGSAQSQGGDFVLEKSTIDAGGRISSGGVFEVIGTIAQPEARIEPASGATFQVYGGFWPRNDEGFLFVDGYEG